MAVIRDERPILMSAPMVRALLSGEKTETRRIVKMWAEWSRLGGGHVPVTECPYGLAGDRLWVRETWAQPFPEATHRSMDGKPCFYRADGAPGERYKDDGTWRPSIFMRRSLSRITLDVTSVRVEPLHAIDDAAVTREGVTLAGLLELLPKRQAARWRGAISPSPRELFMMGWATLNGAGSWARNPLVWVVSFMRVRG